MMGVMLPDCIAIQETYDTSRCYLYYNEKERLVYAGEQSVFSTLVKIEVERATRNPNYVHLRFSNFNRYWSKRENSNVVVAESKQPVEDIKDPSCTLFQPVQAPGREAGLFSLNHVPTGQRVSVAFRTWDVYVRENPPDCVSILTYVDWSTLVKLPARVAFKGDNGRGISKDGNNYMQFSSNDPNDWSSGHKVYLMPNGYVRITSDHWRGQFWRRSPSWIWADSDQSSINNRDTLFWPVKVDDNNTIALRNAGNNQYCSRLSSRWKRDMLTAGAQNITKEARLVVQELVSKRNICNVRYQMQDARIYDELPYVAGTSIVTNTGRQEATMAVQVTYQDQKSYTFSRSFSLTAGVEATIKAGVPFIAEGAIKVSFNINAALQWAETTTTTTSVMASNSVPVPARSTATIQYVGTKGTCDVPYSYTQQDKSSANGSVSYTEQADGIYKGTSCYNFRFVIKSTQRLD
ncbi:uncharacterized protein LOC125203862 isoform X2 [Salvia hispanica]|uniref:uncharacterized protein LOC125203862 isoform X2 n=1 Tax=Salvia hispanica TaxID=49212 RepID=UPI0020097F01|nr:uncharacterized protein LOC125203862 isoform X2 [Salvia hispanica]